MQPNSSHKTVTRRRFLQQSTAYSLAGIAGATTLTDRALAKKPDGPMAQTVLVPSRGAADDLTVSSESVPPEPISPDNDEDISP